MITQVSPNAFPLNICSFSTLGSARDFLVQTINHEPRSFSSSPRSVEIPQCIKPAPPNNKKESFTISSIPSIKYPEVAKKPSKSNYYFEIGDFVQKKVKTQNISDALTVPDKVSNELFSSKPAYKFDVVYKRSSAVASHNLAPETKQNQRNMKRISQVAFDREKKQLVYHIDTQTKDKMMNQVRRTRQEVLKEDPMLLLYFYERHLQFLSTPQFNPEKLVKL